MSPSPTTLTATTATTAPAGVTDGAPSGGPVGGPSGLDPQDAASRLARDGPNALEDVRRRSTLQHMAAMLGEPMFALLLAAVVIYLVLGDLGEGAMLGVFVLAVLGLTFYQEGNVVNAQDLQCFQFVDSPEAAWTAIKDFYASHD